MAMVAMVGEGGTPLRKIKSWIETGEVSLLLVKPLLRVVIPRLGGMSRLRRVEPPERIVGGIPGQVHSLVGVVLLRVVVVVVCGGGGRVGDVVVLVVVAVVGVVVGVRVGQMSRHRLGITGI